MLLKKTIRMIVMMIVMVILSKKNEYKMLKIRLLEKKKIYKFKNSTYDSKSGGNYLSKIEVSKNFITEYSTEFDLTAP